MDSGTKQRVRWVGVMFLVIVVILFWSHVNSQKVCELVSVTAGIEDLYNIDNSLIALSTDHKIYIWDWDTISFDKPMTTEFAASQIVCLADKKVLWIPPQGGNRAILSGLDGKAIADLYFDFGWKCVGIVSTEDGQYACLAFKNEGEKDEVSRIRLKMFSLADRQLKDAAELSFEEGFVFRKLILADNAKYAVVLGSSNNSGQAIVVDVAGGSVKCEIKADYTAEFLAGDFGPDGELVYIAGEGIGVYCYNVATGELVRQWQREDYEIPENKTKHMGCVSVSQSGKYLAASSDPSATVWIWDLMQDGEPEMIRTGETYASDIIFSPGAEFVATGSFKVADGTNVWKSGVK